MGKPVVKSHLEFNLVHPLLARPFVDPLNSLLPKLWSRSVAMFHIGRSGSTVLGKLLNETDEIIWDEEIYHSFFKNWIKPNKKRLAEGANFPFDPMKLVRNRMLAHRLIHPREKIYGCEIKFFHLRRTGIELEDYLNYLERLGFNDWIVLERKNYLRVLVSSTISNRKLKNFHIAPGENPQLIRVHLNIDAVKTGGECRSLLKFLQSYREDFRRLEEALRDRHSLKLTYEDDIAENPQVAAKRVCDFLNIPYQEAPVGCGKTNPFSLKEMIVNFEEVRQVLDGTPFEWMVYK